MWWQLLAFELRFHARQPITRACVVAYLVLGAAMARGRFGGSEVLGDAPSSLAMFAGLLSLASYVVTSLLAGGAILRDREHGMEAIVFTTGLDRWSFVTSRAAGLAWATLGCVSAGMFGLMLGRFLPGVDPERFGPLAPASYLWAWGVMVVPTVLFGVAVVFAAGALSRSALVTFVSGLGLYAFYWVGSILGNSPLMAQSKPLAPGEANLGALLEPTGMVASLEQTRFWSTAEHNHQLVPVAGLLLQNRLLWVALTLLTFAATVRVFAFRTAESRAKKPVAETTATALGPTRPIAPAAVTPVSLASATLSHTHILLRSFGRHLPLIGAAVLWIPFVFVSVTDVLRSGDLDTTLRATSELVIPALLEPIRLFGSLLVVYFASELCWRERALRFDGILDAAPASVGARLLGRLLMLLALIAGLILCGSATALVIQLVTGETPALAPYLSLWSRGAVPLAALSGIAVLVHALAPNRWVGLGATIAVVVFGSGLPAPTAGLISHPLFKLGTMPRYRGSALAGTFDAGAVLWWCVYWLTWMVLAVALAWAASRRGTRRTGWGRAAAVVAAGALVAAIGTGIEISRRTHTSGTFLTAAADLAWRAAYERHTAAEAERPTVEPTAITLRGDFEPNARTLHLVAQIELANTSAAPLDRVTLQVDPRLHVAHITLAGQTPQQVDPSFGSTTFDLPRALAPGATVRLEVDARLETSAFARLDPEAYVTPGASYVEVHKLLPSALPRQDWWIQDPLERRRHGLPEVPTSPPLREPQPPHPDWVSIDATWSTAGDQLVVAAGVDVRRWEEDGRAFLHSRSNGPMPLALGVASADYQVARDRWNNVDTLVYHAADHAAAAPDLLHAAATTLELAGSSFAPYPDPQLVIAEIPAFSERFGATSNPGAIFAVENRIFLEREGQPRIAARAIAHEVAHQWWGRLLDPAAGPGQQMLTEVLAVSTEGLVARTLFDPITTSTSLERLAGLYFSMRGYGPGSEPPLVDTENSPAVHYFKGAMVAHALEQHLGRERLLGVLRDFLADHAYPAKPIAWQLAGRLEAAAPAEVQRAVRELLTEVVTYELELHSIQGPTAGFVEVDLAARRRGAGTLGGFWLEIRLGAPPGESEIRRVWIAAERSRHRLPWAGVRVPEVELDPRRLLIRPPRREPRNG